MNYKFFKFLLIKTNNVFNFFISIFYNIFKFIFLFFSLIIIYTFLFNLPLFIVFFISKIFLSIGIFIYVLRSQKSIKNKFLLLIINKDYLLTFIKILGIKILLFLIFILTKDNFMLCESDLNHLIHTNFTTVGTHTGISAKTTTNILETIGLLTLIIGGAYSVKYIVTYFNGDIKPSITNGELFNKLHKMNNEILELKAHVIALEQKSSIPEKYIEVAKNFTKINHHMNEHFNNESKQIAQIHTEFNAVRTKFIEFDTNLTTINTNLHKLALQIQTQTVKSTDAQTTFLIKELNFSFENINGSQLDKFGHTLTKFISDLSNQPTVSEKYILQVVKTIKTNTEDIKKKIEKESIDIQNLTGLIHNKIDQITGISPELQDQFSSLLYQLDQICQSNSNMIKNMDLIPNLLLNESGVFQEINQEQLVPFNKQNYDIFYLDNYNFYKKKNISFDDLTAENIKSSIIIETTKNITKSESVIFISKILYDIGNNLLINSITLSSLNLFFTLCNRFLGTSLLSIPKELDKK